MASPPRHPAPSPSPPHARVSRGQHAVVAVPVGARWGHQLGDALDQLQWRAHQFTAALIGLQRLVVPFAATVNQISASLLEAIHGEWWAGQADHYLCDYPAAPKTLAVELTRNHIERDATGCVRAPHAPGLGIIMITEQAARRYQIDTELRVSCRSL